MKYLCLGYLNYEEFIKAPQEKRDALLEECYAFCIPFRETGKVVEETGLRKPSASKCIRARNGRQTVTDGPFIETKEQLGSFFIVEAESMEEAIAVASLHPGAFMGEEYGFGIEVRPYQ